MDEAELLFTGILNCDRQGLYFNRKAILRKAQARVIGQALRRRMKGEPLQYILGKTEFMGMEFRVGPGVFIPRPETEVLVETAVRIVLQCSSAPVPQLRILDLCTGSGCIAVSLAKMLPDLEVTATDVSPCALQTARENARSHNVTINFIQSNLFAACELRVTTYELIICNPPYVAAAEINNLQPEISYEPRLALDGGTDGLDFYRRIIRESGDYLEKGGFLIMEMGFNQYPRIEEIFRDSGKFDIIEAIRDYNHINRVVIAQYVSSAEG
jgi:release factor glutamine methyltransferase